MSILLARIFCFTKILGKDILRATKNILQSHTYVILCFDSARSSTSAGPTLTSPCTKVYERY